MRVSENRIIIDELETIKERLENGFKLEFTPLEFETCVIKYHS